MDSVLQFSFVTTALLLVALLIFDLVGGAPTPVLLGFAPALVWAMVIALKMRR